MGLFAEIANDPLSVRRAVRSAARTSLAIGGALAALLAIAAPRLLGLLGPEYRTRGVVPLRILVLGFLPLTVAQLYAAVCRSRHRTAEAARMGAVSCVLTITAAAVVAQPHGLVGIAWACVLAPSVTACITIARVHALLGARPRGASAMRPRAVG